ncbi:MAG: Asp23/Gls24 family envelope stress response protein [Oscillospiraceae bacterium]
MEVKKVSEQAGSLYISTSVIEKVAKIATLEIEGVSEVSIGSSGVKGVFAKTNLPKPVEVTMYDGVAEITVNIVVKYGFKVSSICKNIQETVKTNVQSMTDVTVSKVNIVVAGVQADS